MTYRTRENQEKRACADFCPHVHTHMVSDARQEALLDPPCRVRVELEAHLGVELLRGLDKAHRALLDQIRHREAAVLVIPSHAHDDPQIRRDHVLLGLVGYGELPEHLVLREVESCRPLLVGGGHAVRRLEAIAHTLQLEPCRFTSFFSSNVFSKSRERERDKALIDWSVGDNTKNFRVCTIRYDSSSVP